MFTTNIKPLSGIRIREYGASLLEYVKGIVTVRGPYGSGVTFSKSIPMAKDRKYNITVRGSGSKNILIKNSRGGTMCLDQNSTFIPTITDKYDIIVLKGDDIMELSTIDVISDYDEDSIYQDELNDLSDIITEPIRGHLHCNKKRYTKKWIPVISDVDIQRLKLSLMPTTS